MRKTAIIKDNEITIIITDGKYQHYQDIRVDSVISKKSDISFQINVIRCPVCDRLENIGMVDNTCAVIWCACGSIIQINDLNIKVIGSF